MSTVEASSGGRGSDGRDESPEERADRNWAELLQELRVSQMGVQILSGFLLTLPFQQRFAGLSDYERGLYLVTVVIACVSTMLLIMPVAIHRALFRRHRKDRVVDAADRLARAGLATLALAVTGVIALVFTVVLGDAQGVVAGGLLLLALVLCWWFVPRRLRRGAA